MAISMITILDGAYASSQIATLPKDGGAYNFVTDVGRLPNAEPTIRTSLRTGGEIFFRDVRRRQSNPDRIFSVPAGGRRVSSRCVLSAFPIQTVSAMIIRQCHQMAKSYCL